MGDCEGTGHGSAPAAQPPLLDEGVGMLALIVVALIVFLVLGVLGFVIKGLFWLAIIGILLFLVTAAFGAAKRSTLRR
jgi:hypothetical protein